MIIMEPESVPSHRSDDTEECGIISIVLNRALLILELFKDIAVWYREKIA